MARPTKLDKKQAISLKLPPWLIEWMDRQPENRAVLIETALTSWYQIPPHIQDKPSPVKGEPEAAAERT